MLDNIIKTCNDGNLNIIVKTTKRCNIRPACKYCYDFNDSDHLRDMSLSTLDNLMRVSLGNNQFQRVTFTWHGGEPLLLGIPFYERALQLQRKYPNVTIQNRIQTNAVALNETWISFLKENDFTLESSFDAFDNDFARGRTSEVLSNLIQCKVLGFSPINIMFITTKHNIHRLREAYDFFNVLGLNFNPSPFLSLGNGEKASELKISATEYGDAIIDLIEYIIDSPQKKVRVRFIDAVINAVFLNQQSLCSHQFCTYSFITCNNNGDLFHCAKIENQDWILGNVNKLQQIKTVFETPKYKRLAQEVTDRLINCSVENDGSPCNVLPYCKGGCSSNALVSGGFSKRDFYCETYKKVFNHILQIK